MEEVEAELMVMVQRSLHYQTKAVTLSHWSYIVYLFKKVEEYGLCLHIEARRYPVSYINLAPF